MTDRQPLPPELAELDARLRAVAFEPRASLGPEIAGRAARGEAPRGAPPRPWWRTRAAAAAASLLLAAGAWYGADQAFGRSTIDRCCSDFDGGDDADDGVVVTYDRRGGVVALTVYEDADGSRSFTPADVVRLARGRLPSLDEVPREGLATLTRCCDDLDGGGDADDGVLVLGHWPDRVVLAAIYETGREAAGRPRLR